MNIGCSSSGFGRAVASSSDDNLEEQYNGCSFATYQSHYQPCHDDYTQTIPSETSLKCVSHSELYPVFKRDFFANKDLA